MTKNARIKEIPVKKKQGILDLVGLAKNNKTLMIVSIKNLPSSQFQAIKKKLRENATIKVAKKSIMERAIDSIEKGTIKNFKVYLKEDQAFIFSNLDPFELSAILSKNKSMSRARVGQVVSDEIVIEEGATDLVPGPIISELNGLGLKFSIEDGKISIKEKKIILKPGEIVSEQAASIMSKLDIKPIAVGLEPIVAYDSKEDKIFENIKIDPEKTLTDLKSSYGKALAFAVKIAYACKDTIKFLLGKAKSHELVISKLIKTEPVEGIKEAVEEKAAEIENKKDDQTKSKEEK